MARTPETEEYMLHSAVDQEIIPTRLVIDTDFGPGNEGTLQPEPHSGRESVHHVADPEYAERMLLERWFCMDDGMEALGGQLPGGIMITEVAGALMDSRLQPQPLSVSVAETTQALVADGIEVWVHGDTSSGKEGCAANKFMRDILRNAGRNGDVVAPTVWALMEGLGLDGAIKRAQVRKFIDAGAERADDDSLWDVTPAGAADIAVASGANYHVLHREHRTECSRIDLSSNIFNNHKFRETYSPLGALSVTLGAYKDSLMKRAQKHGYDEGWVAEKVMQAAIFSVASSKKLGGPRLRLAVVA